MSFIITIIATVFLLGICILIHELGHFIVGRLCGIRVEKFSIGYGKALFKIEYRGTIYQIGVFPLGGFVKFAGEDNTGKIIKSGKADEFYSATPWKRILTIFAGPAMNYLLGLFIFIMLFFIGFNMKTLSNTIVLDMYDTSDNRVILGAEKAGLKNGDKIIELNWKKIRYWHEIREELFKLDDEITEINVKVDRAGNIKSFNVEASKDPFIGGKSIGVLPYFPAKVGDVLNGYPAEGKLLVGDIILSVNDTRINDWYYFTHLIRKNPAKLVKLKIKRNDEIKEITLIPAIKEGKGFIGISIPEDVTLKVYTRYGLFKSFYMGAKESIVFIGMNLWGFGKLLTGKIKNPRNAIGGPIMIAKMAGEAAREGISTFFQLMARISIILMIMNLLPFPILDGSHILFYTIEWIIGKPINEKFLEKVFQFGFIVLILFSVFVILNDISKLDFIKTIFSKH